MMMMTSLRSCSRMMPESPDVAQKRLRIGVIFALVSLALFLGWLRLLQPLHAQDVAPDQLKYGVLPPNSLSILNTRWYVDPHSKNGYDPAFSVTVQNLSQERILLALLKVVISTDNGRHVLRRDRLAHFLPSPLEPGQTARWELFPKPYGSPGLDDYPADTQVEVTVEKLYCPKKNGPYVHEFHWELPSRYDYAW